MYTGQYITNTGRFNLNFNLDRVKPVKNIDHVKPEGGLWCCRKDDPDGFGWRDWCMCNQPDWIGEMNAIITLKKDARILVIDSLDTFMNKMYFITKPDFSNGLYLGIARTYAIDYEKMAQDYDMIDFRFSEIPGMYTLMYGLDCDSCLIMNKDAIESFDMQKEEFYTISEDENTVTATCFPIFAIDVEALNYENIVINDYANIYYTNNTPFYGIPAKTITFNKGVEFSNFENFVDCENLETIIINGATNIEETDKDVIFQNCPNIKNFIINGKRINLGKTLDELIKENTTGKQNTNIKEIEYIL